MRNHRILLLGRDGQLGRELQRSLAPLGELWALGRDAVANPLWQGRLLHADLERPDMLVHTIDLLQPRLIVNAAAWTAVDQAEAEPERAHAVNAFAVGVLAQAAARVGAGVVHYSTDYVFDGSGSRPWDESDESAPCNTYGQSKLQGERLLQQHQPRHLIFRTSWLYGRSGTNFARAILQLALQRDNLQVVADQFGAPTSAALAADVTAHAVRCWWQEPALSGLYHLAAAGETSWHGYACWLIEQARSAGWPICVPQDRIVPLAAADWPTAARRPHNSRLDTSRLQDAFGLQLPHWQLGLRQLLAEWTAERAGR